MKLAAAKGFTLVELLVVIAIISILAAMLLPVLENALEMSRRADCLNGKKQLAMLTITFANEHRDLIPGNSRSSDKEMISEMFGYYDQGYNVACQYNSTYCPNYEGGPGTVQVNPVGTLIMQGYIDTPGLLFDPTHPRKHWHPTYGPPSGYGWSAWHYDNPAFSTVWKSCALSGMTSAIPMMWQLSDLTRDSSYAGSHCYRNVTLQFIADYWNRSYKEARHDNMGFNGQEFDRKDQVGPCLWTCLNGPSWAGYSHKLQGVNVSFFDGAGRWMQVKEYGSSYYATDNVTAGLHDWARRLMVKR